MSSAGSVRIAHTKAAYRIRSLPPQSTFEGATEYDELCPVVENVTYKDVRGQPLDGERSGAEAVHAVGAVRQPGQFDVRRTLGSAEGQ